MSAAGTALRQDLEGVALTTGQDLRADLGSWVDLLPDETLDAAVALQTASATLQLLAASDLAMSQETRRRIAEEADALQDRAYRAVAYSAAEEGLED
jgi:hypothetical protein